MSSTPTVNLYRKYDADVQRLAPKPEEDPMPIIKPPTPPPHLTFPARGIHPPTFSAFRPRDTRVTSVEPMAHIAWNCDGRRLAAVGIDKVARVWQPEKSIELRSASIFSGGFTDVVDYVAWNPTHPDLFCTVGKVDQKIVFWDCRQSRFTQSLYLKPHVPATATYSPDGKYLVYTAVGGGLHALKYGRQGEETRDLWHVYGRGKALITLSADPRESILCSRVIFSPAGDCIVTTCPTQSLMHIWSWPGMEHLYSANTHVGGCTATALDPRGRYLATGGQDTIINLFSTTNWTCDKTITCSEYATTGLSFSHDGEYLAISSLGKYIDICATETGEQLHRIPALGPAQTVAWHPTKYLIAYCGQTEKREVGPLPMATYSLFGLQ